MDTNLALGLAGVGLTIIFGLVGLYYSARQRKGSLTCIISDVTVLHEGSERFGDVLVVFYKNARVPSDMFLARLVLYNSGKVDLQISGESSVRLQLADGCEYREASIISCSKDLSATVSLATNMATVSAHLLKPFEFIEIDLLLTLPPLLGKTKKPIRARLSTAIHLIHRIPNTEKIRWENSMPSPPSGMKKLLTEFGMPAFMLCLPLATLIYTGATLPPKLAVTELSSGKTYYVVTSHSSKPIITDSKTGATKDISTTQLQTGYQPTLLDVPTSEKYPLAMLLLLPAVMLSMIVLRVNMYNRNKRVYNALNAEGSKN